MGAGDAPSRLRHSFRLSPFPPMSDSAAKPGWLRGFWSLMATQFQGAFSDNLLKQLIIFIVMARKLPKEDLDKLVSDAGIYFAVPFLLFSAFGGWMADRFSKRTVMMSVKAAEVAIMLFATFALVSDGLRFQLMAICMMGVHSAFFAASKYGSLPEIVPPAKLSWGNGIIEMLTFLAAILGTLAAGWMATQFHDTPMVSGLILIGLALAGLFASFGITKVPAADPTKPFQANFLAGLWREFRWMRTVPDLWRANLGNTGFFFVAVLVQMNLLLYADHVLKVDPLQNSSLQAALALGIGAGSLIAGKLSHDRVEYGLIPIGTLLLAAMSGVLGIPGLTWTWFIVALSLLGVGGGLFIVPIAAVLQHLPPAERKGSVQGAASWLSWVGISAASLLQKQLSVNWGWTPGQIFWFCGAAALVAGVYVAWTRPRAIPEFFDRCRNR